jgi:hypothetical protein
VLGLAPELARSRFWWKSSRRWLDEAVRLVEHVQRVVNLAVGGASASRLMLAHAIGSWVQRFKVIMQAA